MRFSILDDLERLDELLLSIGENGVMGLFSMIDAPHDSVGASRELPQSLPEAKLGVNAAPTYSTIGLIPD